MKKKCSPCKGIVKRHVESDIKDFEKEIKKDRKLVKSIKSTPRKK